MALEAVRQAAPKLAPNFVLPFESPPFEARVHGVRKSLVLTKKISSEKPLLLFPFTYTFKFAVPGRTTLGVTNLRASPGSEEALCLQPMFVDPLSPGKRGIVEPFWCVGVTDSLTEATMALEALTIVPGFGVRVLQQQQVSQTGDSVSLPVLRTVGARSPGEILMVASPKSEESGDCNKNKKTKTT